MYNSVLRVMSSARTLWYLTLLRVRHPWIEHQMREQLDKWHVGLLFQVFLVMVVEKDRYVWVTSSCHCFKFSWIIMMAGPGLWILGSGWY